MPPRIYLPRMAENHSIGIMQTCGFDGYMSGPG
ncbi:hypothetical protein ACUXG4_001418 [Cupriavidus metallidurans]